MIKLSIIVPVYNVADYLPRSLDSILNQGLKRGEYEVILINDGSTDDSEAILYDYRNKYPDIFKVITKINEGVSATRNRGIREASGEYVYFMDADDYLAKHGLGTLFEKYPIYQKDILYFSSLTVTPPETLQRITESKILFDGTGLECLRNWRLNFSVCNMIARRSFLMNNDIQFERMYIAEDILFNLDCMLKPCNVIVVNDLIYYYVVRKTSAIYNRSKQKMYAAVNCYLRLFEHIKTAQIVHREDKAICASLENVKTRQLTPLYSRILSGAFNVSEFDKIMSGIIEHLANVPPSKATTLFRFLHRNSYLYPFASLLYRHIFMKMIYPLIGKN